MLKLRLLLWEECNRSCSGCCNKDWNLAVLPVCSDYGSHDLIMLTGGEPMLKPHVLLQIIKEIRQQTAALIYVYTANVDDLDAAFAVLEAVDGITLTLHEQSDVDNMQEFICKVTK